MGQVREDLLALAAARFDQHMARAHDPLDQRLAVGAVLHCGRRDAPARARSCPSTTKARLERRRAGSGGSAARRATGSWRIHHMVTPRSYRRTGDRWTWGAPTGRATTRSATGAGRPDPPRRLDWGPAGGR